MLCPNHRVTKKQPASGPHMILPRTRKRRTRIYCKKQHDDMDNKTIPTPKFHNVNGQIITNSFYFWLSNCMSAVSVERRMRKKILHMFICSP